MSKDSHVTAQNAHSFRVREGDKSEFLRVGNFYFSTLFSLISSIAGPYLCYCIKYLSRLWFVLLKLVNFTRSFFVFRIL